MLSEDVLSVIEKQYNVTIFTESRGAGFVLDENFLIGIAEVLGGVSTMVWFNPLKSPLILLVNEGEVVGVVYSNDYIEIFPFAYIEAHRIFPAPLLVEGFYEF